MPKVKESKDMCVRIKRYNPAKGHKKLRYMVYGMKFEEERNWYRVPESIVYQGKKIDLKSYLENVTQDDNPENEDPKFVFDVVTPAEAERIVKRDRERARDEQYNLRRTGEPVNYTGRRNRKESGDLTTEDIGAPVASRPSRPKRERSTRAAAVE